MRVGRAYLPVPLACPRHRPSPSLAPLPAADGGDEVNRYLPFHPVAHHGASSHFTPVAPGSLPAVVAVGCTSSSFIRRHVGGMNNAHFRVVCPAQAAISTKRFMISAISTTPRSSPRIRALSWCASGSGMRTPRQPLTSTAICFQVNNGRLLKRSPRPCGRKLRAYVGNVSAKWARRQTSTYANRWKSENRRRVERKRGFEPPTLSLARRCSTTELLPLGRPGVEPTPL